MKVKAFTGLVPAPGDADRIASVPYDVVNTDEARSLAENNPDSFLRVVRAEIEFPPETDPYDDKVYERSRANLLRLQEKRRLVREEFPSVYLYRQEMGGHSQIGVTLVCHIDDYEKNRIKKHEKTRPDKENDRTRLTDTLGANTGPVFLTYPGEAAIDNFVDNWTAAHEAQIDFTDDKDVRHTVWRVAETEAGPILDSFGSIPATYVADGHHRSASAFRVGQQRREANATHHGSEDYNWFLAVLFPADQLQILPYNRLVRDLNGRSPEDVLRKISANVEVLPGGGKKTPDGPEQVMMYLEGSWHILKWHVETAGNPADLLDVAVLQNRVLGPVFGIGDPRTDQRIDFVGGIRGPEELESRVDSGEWAAAFSMFPTTVHQLMEIADSGEIMPPKSTWFEPKLRSGLFVYTFDD